MYEQRHADLVFIHVVAQSFQKGVFIVKTGEYFSYGAEYAAFLAFRRVANRRPRLIPIQFIGQAAAVTVVQAGPGELAAVFHIGAASETNFTVRIESILRFLKGFQYGGLRFR